MASILKPAYAFYIRHYQARPILTICTTNAVLAGISDTLTQKYLASSEASLSPSEALALDVELSNWHEPHLVPRAATANSTSEVVQAKKNQAKDRMGQMASEGKESAKETLNQQRAKASEAMEQTKDRMGQIAADGTESVKETLNQERAKVSEALEETKVRVADKAHQMTAGIKDTVKEGEEAHGRHDDYSHKVDVAKDRIKGAVENVRNKAHHINLGTKDTVKEGEAHGRHDDYSQKVDVAKDRIKGAVENVKNKAHHINLGTKDTVKEEAHGGHDEYSQKVDVAKDRIKGAVENVKNKAHQITAGTKDTVKDEEGHGRHDDYSQKVDVAKDRIKGAVENVKNKAHQMTSSSGELDSDNRRVQYSQKVDEAENRIKHAVSETKNQVSQKTHEVKDKVHDSVYSVKDIVTHRSDLPPSASLDVPRLGRFMLYNFSVAPLIQSWYIILDKSFPALAANSAHSSALAGNAVAKGPMQPSSKFVRTVTPGLKRMVADQALFAPVGLALLFSGLTVLEGGGVKEIKDKMSNTYIDTLKANYMVWPLVQLVNFSVMPLQLRLPFVGAVGIAWNAYLSFQNARAQQLARREMQQAHSTISTA